MTKTVAIVGGGVIGGGWAARFLLMGWDVRIFDPDPDAQRKIGEILENARRSLPGLSDFPMPDEGRLSFHTDLSAAVSEADWIQESVPERIDIKHKIYNDIQGVCRNDAVLGSSTSGYKPSELQEGAVRPGQIVVTHPFNPVYLLPLVELVTSEQNPPEITARAKSIIREIGMYPLHVRKEIDAHIADRFLEAVWREALWLIKDGIATTEEIDDAIRYGFGLRWAQMGLFETYRIAGGEAGMAHFIEQFGPCLASPWTKLMDVPELTQELVQTIATQSDEQSGTYTIRDLERIRDNNLVAMMRALKVQDFGAGALLKAADTARKTMPTEFDEKLVTVDRAVPLDWTDYNGHMNEAKYLQAFGDATDLFMELVGCDSGYIAGGMSYFTAETHIRHIDEVHAGTKIQIKTTCLLGEGKKMHLFHEMFDGERLLATGEHMLIHVSLETRRACAPSVAVGEKLATIARAHAGLTRPEGVGAAVGVR